MHNLDYMHTSGKTFTILTRHVYSHNGRGSALNISARWRHGHSQVLYIFVLVRGRCGIVHGYIGGRRHCDTTQIVLFHQGAILPAVLYRGRPPAAQNREDTADVTPLNDTLSAEEDRIGGVFDVRQNVHEIEQRGGFMYWGQVKVQGQEVYDVIGEYKRDHRHREADDGAERTALLFEIISPAESVETSL